MRNKERLFLLGKRLAVMTVVCLYSLCILYGCTRKEELVLLTENGQGQTQVQEFSVETVETAQISGTGNDDDQILQQESAALKEQDLKDAGEAGKGSTPAYIEEAACIYVHVCGAVITPGVYQLTAGSRVYDAVQAAGGFAECADESYVNQAQKLPDGAKLVIPTREEASLASEKDIGGQEPVERKDERQVTASGAKIGILVQESADPASNLKGAESGQTAEDGRVNINTATEEELCKIPGIGATRAAAIVSYREDHGGFKSPEDIMQVNGIKEGTYEKIKDNISVK